MTAARSWSTRTSPTPTGRTRASRPTATTRTTSSTTFGNQFIDGGINTKDRAEFYVPWVMNKGNTDQLFLGSYRLYRTDNAKAASAGDVLDGNQR